MSKANRKDSVEVRKTLLRVGDPVIILSGSKEEGRKLKKGDKGTLKSFFGAARDRVIVEGLNKAIRHKKASTANDKSEKVEKEAPFSISRVGYYVEALKKPVKLKVQASKDGKKQRGYHDPKSKEFIALEK